MAEPLVSCPAPDEGKVSDVQLIQTLQDKLTSLMDQVHGWKAAVKGLFFTLSFLEYEKSAKLTLHLRNFAI